MIIIISYIKKRRRKLKLQVCTYYLTKRGKFNNLPFYTICTAPLFTIAYQCPSSPPFRLIIWCNNLFLKVISKLCTGHSSRWKPQSQMHVLSLHLIAGWQIVSQSIRGILLPVAMGTSPTLCSAGQLFWFWTKAIIASISSVPSSRAVPSPPSPARFGRMRVTRFLGYDTGYW